VKLYSIVIICLFVFSTLATTKIDYPTPIVFTEKNSHVKIDAFGNIYVITKNEIIKYNSKGLLQKKFSTKRNGKLDMVDVMNPLKILVYFKDFQQIMFLDDQLSEASSVIYIDKLGYEQTSVVCSSTNNSFWIFDKQNNELLRFNSDLKNLVKTGNLKRILDTDINPNFMLEHNNFIYLNSPNQGILVFDIYGTFYKTIPLKNLKEFNVINGDIFYFENQKLIQYQSKYLNTIEKQFSDSLITHVYFHNNTIYKLYKDSVVVN
jgi:hypothetical protein